MIWKKQEGSVPVLVYFFPLKNYQSADRGSVLVLRKFSLCLPEYEFRAFVYKRQLTGVSQYCYSQFFPHMLVRRTEIEKAIVQFFKETMRLYPMDNFVCDVFLTWPNDTSLPKVEIIELNPVSCLWLVCFF